MRAGTAHFFGAERLQAAVVAFSPARSGGAGGLQTVKARVVAVCGLNDKQMVPECKGAAEGERLQMHAFA